MSSQNLVRMANRIGDFFEAMPDRDRALEDIVDHIRKFWAPRMRSDMLDHLDHDGGAGLTDILVVALTRHRAVLAEGLVSSI